MLDSVSMFDCGVTEGVSVLDSSTLDVAFALGAGVLGGGVLRSELVSERPAGQPAS